MATEHASAQGEAVEPEPPVNPDWAWAPYVPDAKHPWNLLRAGHLFRRAGFGATWSELAEALALGPERTLDRLLHPEADIAAFDGQQDEYEALASEEALPAWWLRRMLVTPHPLKEKMTLFWHGHFAARSAEVKSARLMTRHMHLLRSQALGKFDTLLDGVSHDPAMLASLGCRANRKARPSDSYVRSMMELFTLGSGNFSDVDIQEAARAFTGWFVLRDELRYIAREHDTGTKKILGQRGNFGSKDVVRIALRQPATPRHLVRKLYRWFLSETTQPADSLIEPLAKEFGKDYDTGKLVSTMLRSNLFFSRRAYRQRVKSPVEFALGIVRPLEGVVGTTQLAKDLADLGQRLYRPPTVSGWVGGRTWINQFTMISRSNLAEALLATKGPYESKLEPQEVAAKHGHGEPEAASRFLIDLFLGGDASAGAREAAKRAATGSGSGEPSERVRQAAHWVVTLPEFHLS